MVKFVYPCDGRVTHQNTKLNSLKKRRQCSISAANYRTFSVLIEGALAIRRTPNFATQSCKVFKLKISLKYSVIRRTPNSGKNVSQVYSSQLNSLILS